MTDGGCRTCYGKNSECRLWSPALRGARSSAALFDPYSFAHMVGAGLQFFLIPPLWLGIGAATRVQLFVLNLLLHAAFEAFENAPCVIWFIRRYRCCGDPEYEGDSVLNVVGDLLSFSFAYGLSAVLLDAAGPLAAAAVPTLALVVFLAFYSSPNATLE